MFSSAVKKSITALVFAAVLALTCASVFFGAALPGISARAETNAKYYLFDNVTAISSTGDGFVVADSAGLNLFNSDGTPRLAEGTPGNVCDSISGAVSLASADGVVFAVTGGVVTAFHPADNTTSALEGITAAEEVALAGGRLYVLSGGAVNSYSLDGTDETPVDVPGTVTGISSLGGRLICVVSRGVYSDVCFQDGEIICASVRTDGAIAATESGIYCILRNGSVAKITESGEAETVSGKFASAICADGDGILFATDAGEIFRHDGVSASTELLLASDSDAEGFYSHPSDAAARFGRLIVADTLNDRLAIVSGTTTYISVPRPISVWTNNAGRTVVAHSSRSVSILSESGELGAAVEFPAPVTEVFADNNDLTYVLAGGVLYTLAEGGEPAEVATGVTAAAPAFGGDRIFVATGTEIREIGEAGVDPEAEPSAVLSAEIHSFAVDAAGVFFAIVGSERKLVKAVAGGEPEAELASSLGSERSSVSISRTAAGGANYGDLIVVDSFASVVSFIPAADAGVITAGTESPTVVPYDEENILRKLIAPTTLYGSVNETDVVRVLPMTATVMVAKYIIPEDANMSYVFYEDAVAKVLVGGYVFRSAIGQALPYLDPPADSGVVYTATAGIYAMPSLYAAKLVEHPERGTSVTLLPFADYISAEDTAWYRVRTSDGVHGYLPVMEVSVRDHIPGGVRPQYNAEIKSYRGSLGADTYKLLDDGTYRVIENNVLPTHTEVEVVGHFDTSLEYTKIRYFDEKLGTLECYVKTVYIDYNSFSVVQIVAIVVGTLTFILLVALLIRLYVRHRKI